MVPFPRPKDELLVKKVEAKQREDEELLLGVPEVTPEQLPPTQPRRGAPLLLNGVHLRA